MRKFTLLLMVVPLLLFMACETDMDEPAMDTPTFEQEQQEFHANMETSMAEIESQLSELENRVQDAPEDRRDDLESEADDLRDRYYDLQDDSQDVETEDEGLFQTDRSDIEERMNELHRDVESARLRAIADRQEFRDAAQQRLSEIDNMINMLGQGGQGMAAPQDDRAMEGQQQTQQQQQQRGAQVQEDYSSDIEDLRERHREIEEDLMELDDATDDDFNDHRDDIAGDIAELGYDVRDLEYRMERDRREARHEARQDRDGDNGY